MSDPSPNLESKLEELKKRVDKLPDFYKPIGEKALELCQQDVSLIEYELEIERYSNIREARETRRYDRSLLSVLLLAEDIVFQKESPVYA